MPETSGTTTRSLDRPPLQGVAVKLAGAGGELFHVKTGARLYTDQAATIAQIAPELRGLAGIRIPQGRPRRTVWVEFELPEALRSWSAFSQQEEGGGRFAAHRRVGGPLS